MSETKTGFVEKVFNTDGTSSRGKWYAYSFKLVDANNVVDPMFYQLGFNKPCGFKEGDYISFEADPKDDKAMTVVEGSGSILKNAPARAAKEDGGGKSYGGGAKKVTKSDLFGDIGGFYSEDDIRRMSYSAATGHAIDLVGMLLSSDGLVMSEANTKAGTAKRFESITAAVDKLTIEFFYDSATGRKLDTVADAGNVDLAAPDAQLPDAPAEREAPEATPDESGPPPADDGDTSGTF